MPKTVVYGLQAIHIKKNDAKRPLRAARAVQFRFQHTNEPAVISQSGQRIADRHGAHLVKEARLIEQSAAEHDQIAGRLAQLRKEKRAVEKMPGENRGEMADKIQGCDDEKRVVVDRRGVLGFAVQTQTLPEQYRGEEE